MTTSKFDMMYGRQGGRIVPFAAEAHEQTATCEGCGGPLTNTEARYHRDCEPDVDTSTVAGDEGQGTLL